MLELHAIGRDLRCGHARSIPRRASRRCRRHGRAAARFMRAAVSGISPSPEPRSTTTSSSRSSASVSMRSTLSGVLGWKNEKRSCAETPDPRDERRRRKPWHETADICADDSRFQLATARRAVQPVLHSLLSRAGRRMTASGHGPAPRRGPLPCHSREQPDRGAEQRRPPGKCARLAQRPTGTRRRRGSAAGEGRWRSPAPAGAPATGSVTLAEREARVQGCGSCRSLRSSRRPAMIAYSPAASPRLVEATPPADPTEAPRSRPRRNSESFSASVSGPTSSS